MNTSKNKAQAAGAQIAQHTLGNWQIVGETTLPDGTLAISIISDSLFPNFICHCEGPKRWGNSRLIAAAPELLKAAKLLATLVVSECIYCKGSGEQPHAHQEACHHCGGTGQEVETPEPCDVEQARAAIAKAEGKL